MQSAEYSRMYEVEEEHFYFAGKRRLVEKLLGGVVPEQNRILDVGCGTGITLRSLEKLGRPVGIDVSMEAASLCLRRGLSLLALADAAKAIPFRQGCFDVVCLLDVLEHIACEDIVLEEAHRVLRASGRLIITVPAFPRLYSYHDIALGHLRRYTKPGLLALLEQCGFRPEKVSFFNCWLLPAALITRSLRGFLRKDKPVESDTTLQIPSALNRALYAISSLETRIISRFPLPAGLSLVCVCRKE